MMRREARQTLRMERAGATLKAGHAAAERHARRARCVRCMCRVATGTRTGAGARKCAGVPECACTCEGSPLDAGGARARIRDTRGMTFVEVLVTLVIACLFIAAATTVMNSSLHYYDASLFDSDSRLLASAVDSELSNMLRYATDVETDSSGKVTAFTNERTFQLTEDGVVNTYYEYGIIGGCISVDSSTGKLVYTRSAGASASYPVISEGMPNDMQIADFHLTYDEDTSVFSFDYKVVQGSHSRSFPGLEVTALKSK